LNIRVESDTEKRAELDAIFSAAAKLPGGSGGSGLMGLRHRSRRRD